MIKATENLRLGDLISRRVPFVVPKYQRAYAWEEDEVKDFVSDIQTLYRARVAGNPRTHFIGGVVSVDNVAPNTYTGRSYDVVDGQQRLATFIMTISTLVAAIEDLANQAANDNDASVAEEARSYANKIKGDYIFYSEVVGSQEKPTVRLKLSRADAFYFDQLVRDPGELPDPTRDSHNRLRSAWEKIRSELMLTPILADPSMTNAEKLKHLLLLSASLTEDCYLIHVVSDNLAEAYKLFAILNDRGKTLSDGDLLRSFTLEMLEGHPTQQDQVELAWNEILKYRDSQIDDYLRTYYPSNLGERAPSRDLADSYRTKFFNKPLPLSVSNADTLTKQIIGLQEESRVYFDLVDGKWPYDPASAKKWDIGRLDRLIKVLKHTICLPLLLSAYRFLDENSFVRLVHMIELFAFRYITIVGAHAGSLSVVYNQNAVKIRTQGKSYNIDELRNALRDLQNKRATDAAFELGLDEQLVYAERNTSVKQIIRHFITTIDDYYPWYRNGASGDPKADKSHDFDLTLATIEHIYPQNPAAGVQDPQLDEYTHKLGNLSIWGPEENQGAGNQPFAAKQDLYGKSIVRLNQYLATLPAWDEQSLQERKKLLIEIAKRIFSV